MILSKEALQEQYVCSKKILKYSKKSGVRVILDGQGADELFAGYDGYEMDLIDSFLEVGSYKQLLLFLARWSVGENRGLLRGSKSFTACMLKKYAPRFYRGLFDRKHTPPEWINSDYFEQNQVNLNFKLRDENYIPVYGRSLMSALRNDLTSNRISRLLRYE